MWQALYRGQVLRLAWFIMMFVVVAANTTRAAEHVLLEDDDLTAAQLDRSLATAKLAVERSPDSANGYIDRGMAFFSKGMLKESLADFDKAKELNKRLEPQLWQRGIALYYVGRYADAAAQFKIHHDVNPDDVENTAWYFLCVAKSIGLQEAKRSVIPSQGDARSPMMEIWSMYAGKLSPEDLAAQIELKDLSTKFYAYLYIGLYYEALGDAGKADVYIDKAVEQDRGGYMLRVAKVDQALRRKKP